MYMYLYIYIYVPTAIYLDIYSSAPAFRRPVACRRSRGHPFAYLRPVPPAKRTELGEYLGLTLTDLHASTLSSLPKRKSKVSTLL